MSGPVDVPSGHDDLVERLVAELPAWLPTQRWFAGKDRPITAVRPASWSTVRDGDPLLLHLVVEVEQGDRTEPYQLLIGRRQSDVPDVASSASIGPDSGLACYEASGDADLTASLLELMATGAVVDGLAFEAEPGVELVTGLRAHPITSEQSNTSLVYGNQYILKLFRKLTPGLNKDLQLHRALREVGCEHIADPLGSISGELNGEPVTIGMLQRFMPDAADGWVMATTSVRDFMAEGLPPEELGGDFASEAARLGRAIATMHADLARALGTEEGDRAELARTVTSMLDRLDRVAADVPELADHVPALRAAFEKVGDIDTPVPMQYVHGDLHLGQVLRTLLGWLVLDFEGEPAASLAERSALRSPLRDVAGMLRSFDYAAQQLLVGQPEEPGDVERAMTWAARNRSAFCDGYAAVAGSDPRDQTDLLRALELDKAVYEVGYEHANRPDWLAVPLSSIARLMTEEETA
ncbi:maltokinase N-terminal cap-like domain-containing protein [Aeromicrobium stalagmiti]|uniref:maltokinase N-terminal cap-like domain-containing protein n=1 Tax=Aeromicrobium stalagmiti TaxID=2738988 RepID=UPI001569FF64|nr:phosphotransferase [Aeromicrobium stalagmiti]NRQ50123.1 aminoglycoside phosphotransferase [Aeromicrobium stalagmiti]